ncbi:MAG: sodium:proton antiporter [Desulfobacterales bacterium]|nr:sodium:proton antiporter [Desulfobacterales bacterium]
MPTMITSQSAVSAPPIWTVIPFAVYLLMIAFVPLFAGRFWEKNRNKFILALIASIPAMAYLVFGNPRGAGWLLESIKEYVAFITLLASLFVISGGVYLKGSLAGTPVVNTALLAIGAVLASCIGTTGASVLLIRPLIRANEKRQYRMHIAIFFIFIVSNGGGMLTPLGDPPLFLGFLRGVPFLWTIKLLGPWALANGLLLVIFNFVDQIILNREERARPEALLEEVQKVKEPLRIQGGLNFVWLLGVIAVIFLVGAFGDRISGSRGHEIPNHQAVDSQKVESVEAAQAEHAGNPELKGPETAGEEKREGHYVEDIKKLLQVVGMVLMAALSLLLTRREVRAANRFTWGPIIEVAVIFVGIFITMAPALKVLELRGGELGLSKQWHFFWASGVLSSFLDNAPTYLTFSALAVGVVNAADPSAHLVAANLGGLVHHSTGALLLTAVSCGSVLMGANTYIGNGPNFMVKAIVEENKIKMPGFFGYMLWSIGILIPLFVIITLVFFRG